MNENLLLLITAYYSDFCMTFVHSFKIRPNSNNNRSIIIFIVYLYDTPCTNMHVYKFKRQINNNKINNKSTLSIFGLALISVVVVSCIRYDTSIYHSLLFHECKNVQLFVHLYVYFHVYV